MIKMSFQWCHFHFQSQCYIIIIIYTQNILYNLRLTGEINGIASGTRKFNAYLESVS